MNILSKKNIRKLLLIPALVVGFGLMASPVALAVEGDDGTDTAEDCGISSGLTGGMNCAGQSDSLSNDSDVGGVFKTVTDVLLFVVGAVAVIMLIYGGFKYVTSSGDAQAVTSAKNTIMYAVIGIVVAIMSFALLSFVTTQLGTGGGTDDEDDGLGVILDNSRRPLG